MPLPLQTGRFTVSEGARKIPIEQARAVGCALVRAWLCSGLPSGRSMAEQLAIAEAQHGVILAGSARRGVEHCGDVELLAPAPIAPGARDDVCERIKAVLLPEETTVLYPPAGAWASEVKGVKPGFRYAQVIVYPRLLNRSYFEDVLGTEPDGGVKVDLFRYVPGAAGNFGWISLIRTGPHEFGEACLVRWKRISGGGCSHAGFPRVKDKDSAAIAVPDEAAAFALLKMPFIEPRDRRGDHPSLAG